MRRKIKNDIENNNPYGKVQMSCCNIHHESKTDFNKLKTIIL